MMKVKDRYIIGGMFLFLLVFYILQKTVYKPDSSSFREELTQLDSLNINHIKIKNAEASFELSLYEDNWKLDYNGKTFDANEVEVNQLLTSLSNLKTRLLHSREKEKWIDYGVDEKQAKTIQIAVDERMITSLHIGKYEYDEEKELPISYLRLSDEAETYSCESLLSKMADAGPNVYRESQLFDFNPGEIQKISRVSGDFEDHIQKNKEGNWSYQGKIIYAADIHNYLKGLSQLKGAQFNDSFNPDSGFGVVEAVILDDSIKMDVYLDPSGDFSIKTNQNEAFFLSDSTTLLKKGILDLDDLLSGKTK